MTIFKLTLNKVLESELGIVASSYRAPRQEKFSEYFKSKESAEKRRAEIYDGSGKLLGYIPSFEVIINEVEVKE